MFPRVVNDCGVVIGTTVGSGAKRTLLTSGVHTGSCCEVIISDGAGEADRTDDAGRTGEADRAGGANRAGGADQAGRAGGR